MKQFRKFVFWCHLLAGVVAGVVVLIMSVTGVLLMYERQISAWADTRSYQVSRPADGRLSAETILSRVRETEQAKPTSVVFRAGADTPAEVKFGRERTLFVNPYTGEALGEGSKGVHSFFHLMTDWHRWLGAGGEGRAVGKAITGACNLAFLFLVVSGFYLWWPRKWTRSAVRSVTVFRQGLSGRARDFNWHNVIGFWSAIPLFIIVLSGVVISYPWASNLVYRAVGETPPVRRGPGGGPGGPGGAGAPGGRGPGAASVASAAQGSGEGRRDGERPGRGRSGPAEGRREGEGPARGGRGSGGEGRGRQEREAASASAEPVSFDGLDRLLAKAETQISGWQALTLQIPSSADSPVEFTVEQGTGGQPQKRTRLTLARDSGEVVKVEPFSSSSLGSRIRSFLRFAHTGEYFGLVGQTVAGIVSAGAAVLVWTGLALTWRRWRFWKNRRSPLQPSAAGAENAPSAPVETVGSAQA